MINRYLNKIPPTEHLISFYAVLASILYGWSIYLFFWTIPSWGNFLTLGEIAVIFSYMIVVNLIESLFVGFFILMISLILPPAWFSEHFLSKGVLIIVIGLGFLMYRNFYFPTKALSELPINHLWILLAVGLLILLFPVNKIPYWQTTVEAFADRFVIFLYILLPISALSIVITLARNLF
jgi:hypothetical protein